MSSVFKGQIYPLACARPLDVRDFRADRSLGRRPSASPFNWQENSCIEAKVRLAQVSYFKLTEGSIGSYLDRNEIQLL